MAEISSSAKQEAELHDGAKALQALLADITSLGNETVLQFGDDGEIDGRDYVAITAIVESSVDRNIIHSTSATREGYLRALTDALCMLGDGVSPCDDWNPIQNTALAFGDDDLRLNGEATVLLEGGAA